MREVEAYCLARQSRREEQESPHRTQRGRSRYFGVADPLGDFRRLVNRGWRIGLRHRRRGANYLAPIRSDSRDVQ